MDGDNESNDSKGVVVSLKKSSRFSLSRIKALVANKQSRTILIVLLVIVLAVGGGLYYNANRFAATDLCRGKKTSAIYKEASNLLNPQAIRKLGLTVKKIQGMKNYDRDPNCLYPITVYYLNGGDAKDADVYLKKLEKITGTKKYLSSDYKTIVYTNAEMRQKVTYLNQLLEQSNRNFPQ